MKRLLAQILAVLFFVLMATGSAEAKKIKMKPPSHPPSHPGVYNKKGFLKGSKPPKAKLHLTPRNSN